MRASAEEHPDLFWAIRGGGGNFGVVTSFLFRLHAVGTVVGGPTFWPVEPTEEVLLGLPRVPADRAARAERLLRHPYGAAGRAVPGGAPPAEGLRRRLVLRRPERGRRTTAMAPLLDNVSEPLMHGVQPMPLPALQGAFDGLYPPGDQWYWRADFVNEIPDAAIDDPRALRRRAADDAVDDAPVPDRRRRARRRRRPTRPGATATRRWGSVFAGVDQDPANVDDDHATGRIDYCEALHPYSAGGAYVNMMMDEGAGPRPRQLPRQLRPAGAGEGRLRPGATCSASTRTSSRRRPSGDGDDRRTRGGRAQARRVRLPRRRRGRRDAERRARRDGRQARAATARWPAPAR